MIRFLSSLQAKRVVGFHLTKSILEMLLSYPSSGEDATREACFRIKIITTFLISAKKAFIRGLPKKWLETSYLPYFVQYIMHFEPLPFETTLDIREVYSILKINPPSYASLEEANEAVRLIEERMAKTKSLSSVSLDVIEEDEEDGSTDGSEEAELSSEESSDASSSSDSESENEFEDMDDMEDVSRNIEGRTEMEDAFERELAMAFGSSSVGAVQPTGITPFDLNSSKIVGRKPPVNSETLSLRVMTKKGGRDEKSRSVKIAVPTGVAEKIRKKKEAEAAEKAALKRMVLSTNY